MKVHAAVALKSGGTMTLCAGFGAQRFRGYNGGDVRTVKGFEMAAEESRCAICTRELSKIRARMARKT